MTAEAPKLDPETVSEIEDNEAAEAEPLPDCVTEDEDGSWVFRLQHPLEPTKDDPEGKDIEKIRIPAKMYARNVREAGRHAKSEIDAVFYLAASMTKVPAKLLDRLDARDYSTLSNLVKRRAQHLPA